MTRTRMITALFTLLSPLTIYAVSFNQDEMVWAAGRGDVEAVKKLLEKGRDVNMTYGGNTTALMIAAMYGKTAVVIVLLDKGADVHMRNLVDWTALICAIYSDNKDVPTADREATVDALLVKGADANTKENGSTALIQAGLRGYTVIVQALIAKGANVNAKDTYGSTALMWAIDMGHSPTVKTLLAVKGIDVNVKNNKGKTALMLAEEKDQKEKDRKVIVQLLKDAGAKE